jgi:hypothetical protein
MRHKSRILITFRAKKFKCRGPILQNSTDRVASFLAATKETLRPCETETRKQEIPGSILVQGSMLLHKFLKMVFFLQNQCHDPFFTLHLVVLSVKNVKFSTKIF